MSPLKRGKSKKVISGNIREMVKSKTFGKGKPAKVRHKMAIAAAFRKAGRARKSKRSRCG